MRAVKIFWIDDSQGWVLSAQKNLEMISVKYKVSLHFINAINGEDIVQQCTNFDFDVIVMDYDMNPFFGDKYINDVRQQEHLEHIPILFYSQNNSVDLDSLIKDYRKVSSVFRPNLEEKIKELFFVSE